MAEDRAAWLEVPYKRVREPVAEANKIYRTLKEPFKRTLIKRRDREVAPLRAAHDLRLSWSSL